MDHGPTEADVCCGALQVTRTSSTRSIHIAFNAFAGQTNEHSHGTQNLPQETEGDVYTQRFIECGAEKHRKRVATNPWQPGTAAPPRSSLPLPRRFEYHERQMTGHWRAA